jgi:hypothetical protein
MTRRADSVLILAVLLIWPASALAQGDLKKVDLRSPLLTPPLALEGVMEPIYKVNVLAQLDRKGAGKGTIELDTNAPVFNEFGLVAEGKNARPPMKLACTVGLVKSDAGQHLYEIKIPRVTTPLRWVTLDDGYFERLLVLGKDGKVKHVVVMTDEAREPLPPPCHPGCFPEGTLVRVPGGVAPIEKIRKGDLVTTVDPGGKTSPVKVADVFTTRNKLVKVRTSEGSLVTTRTQPLCLASGEFRLAGELRADDRIWGWKDGKKRELLVLDVTDTKREGQVFNLVLGDSIVFIAGDFLARSKPPFAVSD